MEEVDEVVEENAEFLEESDEDGGVTAQSVLQDIENAWLNEKFAPEILPHQSDAVECMLQQISHMEDNMKSLGKGSMKSLIHQMEINRIRFIISSYLRCRLEKIEQYAMHILTEEAQRGREDGYLSSDELRFAKDYLSSIELLFRTLALQHMPNVLQKFEIETMTVKPNIHAHVFLRANKRITGIIVPGTVDEEVDFEEGSQHIVQYSAVADLVKNGDIQLI
ncbi:DNA replication complex GINS protein SLD5 [Cephus cinctus]|uniref:DNA replication complex GINS protein SLD5 n=1 Tax=Cephus cinctus TaxID=211228 RepID=A0AAJ7CFT7_CEPCN|nr:DNA replication complex GINS protein SLD5 [Cephus cinctus]